MIANMLINLLKIATFWSCPQCQKFLVLRFSLRETKSCATSAIETLSGLHLWPTLSRHTARLLNLSSPILDQCHVFRRRAVRMNPRQRRWLLNGLEWLFRVLSKSKNARAPIQTRCKRNQSTPSLCESSKTGTIYQTTSMLTNLK